MTITFSVVFLAVMAIALGAIYYFFESYRQQEFYQRLKDKTLTTFRLLIEIKEIDQDLLQVLDRNTINSLYDEKLLLFNDKGEVIYNSVDDTPIAFPAEILSQLQHKDDEIEYEDGEYEVFAHRFYDKQKTYYGIIKAKDKYGKSKIRFLRGLLGGIYIIIIIVIVALTRYTSKQITDPIRLLIKEIEQINLQNIEQNQLVLPQTQDEIYTLTIKFQELLRRIEIATNFQRKFIQYLSHELKTPIAVMISQIETLKSQQSDVIKNYLDFQKNGLMQMSNIIDTLLKISKYEEKMQIDDEYVQLDEVIFECFEELNRLYHKASLDFQIDTNIYTTEQICIRGDYAMLKIAFHNLLKNAINYSPDQKVWVRIGLENSSISIKISNKGQTLSPEEQNKIFQYFFRGENSQSVAGMGLGLALVQKIIHLHQGTLQYSCQEEAPQNTILIVLGVNDRNKTL